MFFKCFCVVKEKYLILKNNKYGMVNKELLPYRKNVAIIACKKGRFLIVNKKEWPETWWKFPQGGIKDDETIVAAAKREFLEECRTDKIEIVGVSSFVNKYDWDNQKIVREKKARGQEQYFVVARFLGDLDDAKPDNKELRKIKWFTLKEILEFSEKNKKLFDMYNGVIPKILEEFGLLQELTE